MTNQNKILLIMVTFHLSSKIGCADLGKLNSIFREKYYFITPNAFISIRNITAQIAMVKNSENIAIEEP